MKVKTNSIIRIICFFLITLCCLFVSCEDPNVITDPDNNNNTGDNDYNNPNAGTVRELTFSHNSGLYSQSFNLTLKAAPGSEIYFSTDGSIPSAQKVGSGNVFKYSSPITVENRNGQANVLATAANITQMNMAADDPRGSIPNLYIPTKDQVPKATVIRAIAVDSKGKQSGVINKTYFIGSNLTNYGNHRVISLVTDPYNLIDVNYGIMVRGIAGNIWPNYNFNMKGRDWEREAYLELFEGNGSSRNIPLSVGVGIRVRGGWSRAPGQKSFSVYFREEYGLNNLRNYNLIPGAVKADGKTPVERYKNFMLRNGGNDLDYTKFYDIFLQDLISGRSFTTQAGVPCIVYLNGEYWGPYNLQEKYSDNHTEYKYGVNKDNVISYDNGELDDGMAADEDLYWQMMNMRSKDMSVSADYNAFCAVFDIDNFADYWAAQIYIYNEDWPQNNYRVWRVRNAEPGNPYGDTKWRWQVFDTEFAVGIYNSGGLGGQAGVDAFSKILNGDHKEHHNNQLFKALLANEDFCRRFVTNMMDLYNINFHPDNYLPKLDNYSAIYRPLMNSHFDRWGSPWDGVFDGKVNDARNYLNNIRNEMVISYLPNYFGGYSGIYNLGVSASNLCNVTISAEGGVSGVSIKINTVTPNLSSGSWTGKYYSVIPITVTASAPPAGYEFDGWSVIGGTAVSPSALTTTVNITGDAMIMAKYKSNQSPVIPATGINLNKTSLNFKIGDTDTLTATISPASATYKTVLWSSSDYSVADVDGNGKVTAINGGNATITASTIDGITKTCAVTVRLPIVLLDLAEELKALTPQIIDDWGAFYDAFGGLPINPGGGVGRDSDVSYEIINDNGVIKLQVFDYALWAPGLDIKNDIGPYQAGDRIEVKGTFINGPSNGIVINRNSYGWDPLQGWNEWCSNGQNFQKTFILSADDANVINANAEENNGNAFRLKTGGIDPWNGTDPNGVGSYVIEQIKIYRIE
jgi:hypothetical protein